MALDGSCLMGEEAAFFIFEAIVVYGFVITVLYGYIMACFGSDSPCLTSYRGISGFEVIARDEEISFPAVKVLAVSVFL